MVSVLEETPCIQRLTITCSRLEDCCIFCHDKPQQKRAENSRTSEPLTTCREIQARVRDFAEHTLNCKLLGLFRTDELACDDGAKFHVSCYTEYASPRSDFAHGKSPKLNGIPISNADGDDADSTTCKSKVIGQRQNLRRALIGTVTAKSPNENVRMEAQAMPAIYSNACADTRMMMNRNCLVTKPPTTNQYFRTRRRCACFVKSTARSHRMTRSSYHRAVREVGRDCCSPP